MIILAAALICVAPVAIDGDTVRCEGVKKPLRMSGIDTPEMKGHCRKGRVCVEGDPIKARDSLQTMLSGKVTYETIKIDLYGRPVVILRGDGKNLTCAQLEAKQGIYKPTWDDGKRIKKECGL